MKLEALGIIKTFGLGKDQRRVLDHLTLKVDFPHVLALLGPSGGGKSTLLRVIAGLEHPNAGEVLLDNEPVPFRHQPGSALRTYRRRLGVVFQAFNLFPHMTAFQNVVLPLTAVHGIAEKEAKERSLGILKRLGLSEHGEKLPGQLSGGQRQRVAIARALAVKPEFLLFDEPTSALDPEMTAEVLELIAELRQEGIPMLLVTHEMGFARKIADHVAFLANGRVIEHGEVRSFFSKPQTSEAQRFMAKVLAY